MIPLNLFLDILSQLQLNLVNAFILLLHITANPATNIITSGVICAKMQILDFWSNLSLHKSTSQFSILTLDKCFYIIFSLSHDLEVGNYAHDEEYEVEKEGFLIQMNIIGEQD